MHGENNVRVFQRPVAISAPTGGARDGDCVMGHGLPGRHARRDLSLSANGTSNAILWANEAFGNLPGDPDANLAPTPNILRAYDVSTVTSGTLQSIWDSETEPNDQVGAATKFAPPLVANGRVYQATYDNQVVVYGLGSAFTNPTRDIRRTVVFIYAQTTPVRTCFIRGGAKGGGPSASVIELAEPAYQHLSLGRRLSRLERRGGRAGATARGARRRLAGRMDHQPCTGTGATLCLDGRLRHR